MSGYLHRLVNMVLHPHETVHPRTGSLFAPNWSTLDPNAESFEQAAAVATRPARSQSSMISKSAETAQHPAQSENSQPPLRPEIANEASPLLESVERADVTPPAGDDAQHDTFESAARVPDPWVDLHAQRAVPNSRYDVGVPLIHPQSGEAPGTKLEIPQFSAEARRMRGASASLTADGRPTRAERSPDEIQIHIGRIEVTAVQSPAPRAPKRPETAVSLDAYLERRSGRAR
jgi:hypothetical protein